MCLGKKMFFYPIFATFLAMVSFGTVRSEEKRFVFTNSGDSIQLDSFDLSENLPVAISNGWQVRLKTLRGGTQEGVQVITLDNGELHVTVVPTRGMSILSVEQTGNGKRVFGWDSPVKELVHPNLMDLESRGGLGWLFGFNEWMTRCGIEFAGHPGTDVMRTNTGDTNELNLTLHGRVGNIPASEVELIINDQPPYDLRLRGVVEERMFYGPQLRLVTEIHMLPKLKQFRLLETIENVGASKQEYQIIYHTNFGSPLLDENAKVVIPAKSVLPMNQHAADSVSSYDTYLRPTQGFVEQVYLVEPWSDDGGMTSVVIHNAEKELGALMRWSTSSLPYLTIWKNTAALADGYVTGIEPGTGYPFNRRVERHFGRVPQLAAGESVAFELEYSLLSDSREINAAIGGVNKIMAGRVPEIKKDPPSIPDFD